MGTYNNFHLLVKNEKTTNSTEKHNNELSKYFFNIHIFSLFKQTFILTTSQLHTIFSPEHMLLSFRKEERFLFFCTVCTLEMEKFSVQSP